MSLETNLAIAAAALLIEAAFGYPDSLYRIVRHPVVWIGVQIARLDARLNTEGMGEAERRRNGMIAVTALLLAVSLPAFAVQYGLFRVLPAGFALLVSATLASALIAQRSLFTHVRAVADALDEQGVAAGREAVAKIVGRDVTSLDQAGVARAAIESLAENFSDGVVAPAFWCAALGLPGIAAYKAANTADSMIGHLTPRHAAFGWASAKLDDLLNLPASRLAALWLILAAAISGRADAAAAWRTAKADARKHRSPNAGWPEAAMAGALGIRLGGPRAYHGASVEAHWIGEGRSELSSEDIRRALSLYGVACAVQFAAFAVAALLIALT